MTAWSLACCIGGAPGPMFSGVDARIATVPTTAPGRTHQAGRSPEVPPGPPGRGAGHRRGELGRVAHDPATPSQDEDRQRWHADGPHLSRDEPYEEVPTA